MSKRSRCGGVRNFKLAGEPYAGIVRVEALSLWHRAYFQRGRRTLCGDRDLAYTCFYIDCND